MKKGKYMGFGRRSFLARGTALATTSLLAPLVRTARAQSGPKRLVVFFSPLGQITEEWIPTGSETNFSFGRVLRPLEDFKSKMIVFKGLEQPREAYTGNHKEMPGMLSGRAADGRDEDSSPSHISLDQYLANDPNINGGAAFPSVSLAAWQGRYSDFENRMDRMYLSARGANQAVVPEGLPQGAFDRIFDGFTVSGMAEPSDVDAEQRAMRKRSVLDAVAKELASVQRKLGVSSVERAKIDQHLTSVRELEKRLMSTPFSGGDGGDCRVPQRPGAFRIDDDATLPERLQLHIDVAVAALACDRTRIAVVTAEGGASWAKHPWLGINKPFHEHTHGDGIEEQIKIGEWYAKQFYRLLAGLDAVPEGSGTMLDNTCVLWLSDQGCRSSGQEHMRSNMPYLIAGSCGGYFRTGRLVDADGASTTRLLINIKNAMGSSGNRFGDVEATPLLDLS